MNKIFKGLIRFLIEVIVMTVLIVGINIFTNGMYLWGLPRINDIQSVNITYPSVTGDVKEISSSENIELALKLTGFLKYDLSEFQTGKCICQKRGMDRPFNIRNYAVTCCGGYRDCLLCRYSLISAFYLLRHDQHICAR